MPGTAVYPTITDWDALVRSWLPAPSAMGDGEAFAQALAWPWSVLDADLSALVIGLVDLDAASGYALDLAGSRVNEPRGGLSDTEYRRIVAGRRVAIGSDGTDNAVRLTMAALCGTPDVLIAPMGPAAAWVQGRVPFAPSAAWLPRAASILRDALPLDIELVGAVYVGGSFTFDSGPGFDVGVLAYYLPTG